MANHDTNKMHNMFETISTPEKKLGRPKKSPEERKGGFKKTLNLDKDLKFYLENKAWQDRVSASEYINILIRKDMEEYFKNGGKKDGWKEIN